MKLNFTILSYFRKVAELQHLTRAAEELHIAQPALSRTISQLEEELDTRLFERQGRNIRLTRDGEILLRHTKSLLAELDDLYKDLADSKNIKQMTVGLSIRSASQLIPVFLMKFKQENPDAHLEVITQNSKAALTHTIPDLSLYASREPLESDDTVTLFRENLVMIVPEQRAPEGETSVLLSEFADDKFIAAPQMMSLRKTTDDCCRQAGFEPDVVMESDNPDTVREFVRAGLGVALVPEMTWHTAGENIVTLPVDEPDCHRYLNLSWRTDKKLSLVATLLREYIIDNFWEFVKDSADNYKKIR